MRVLLFSLGIGLMLGSFLFAGYACYRTIEQFAMAKYKYEQDLIRGAFEQ